MSTPRPINSTPSRCPKCDTTEIPRQDEHPSGITLTCPSCAHTKEYDRRGNPYLLAGKAPPDPYLVPHDTVSYPLYLACTTLVLQLHDVAVRLNNRFVTSDAPTPLQIRLYHQPFRSPIYAFRPTRAHIQPGRSYIYAAEMHPYERDHISDMTRQPRDLRTLIQQTAAELTGLDLRATTRSWPICPPGTITQAPLAPHP